jgi:hypothetical protein
MTTHFGKPEVAWGNQTGGYLEFLPEIGMMSSIGSKAIHYIGRTTFQETGHSGYADLTLTVTYWYDRNSILI